MAEKFNGGIGAEICDHCRTMLLEGLRPPIKGGGYERVIKPVVLDAYPEHDPSRLAFCSVRCACLYLLDDETTQPERAAVAYQLMRHFCNGGDIEPREGSDEEDPGETGA